MRLVDNRSGLEALDERACRQLLSTQRVGRVAVVAGNTPLIFPVNYLMHEGAILFRTAEGSKLSGARSSCRMSFEIDGVDNHSREGWSVVVSGAGREVTEPNDLRRLEDLPLEPWSPGPKTHWVRIRPETVTGRRITRSR